MSEDNDIIFRQAVSVRSPSTDGDDDPMKIRMACITCNTTFEFGRCRHGAGGLECPNCRSTMVTCAEGVREVHDYDGVIGTRN